MPTPTFTKAGTKATTPAKLSKAIFEVEIKNHDLLKQAYEAYLANGRTNNAKVLRRGEVRGGGKKPWRQKGTGRARFGSSRVPIWRGGGITFGPTGNENFSQALSVKSKRTALRQALSLANKANKIVVVENFEIKDGKTANTVKLLDKMAVNGRVLLVVQAIDDLLKRATQNVVDLKLVQAKYLNVYDILNVDRIVITKMSLEILVDWLDGKTSKKETKQ